MTTGSDMTLQLSHLMLGLLFVLLFGGSAVVHAKTVPYASCFARSAASHQLSVDLLKAVAATESNFNPNARSHANAHGVMQIQWPGTARHLGVRRLAQLYSPCKNIDWGARYLRELLDKYDDNERRALAAYNYGPGRIKSRGAMPRGALKYIATVHRHRARLSGTGSPARSSVSHKIAMTPSGDAKKPKRKQIVASFSSRQRASRYLKLLQRKIPGAEFRLERGRFRGHALMLTSDPHLLGRDARTLLTSLGWSG